MRLTRHPPRILHLHRRRLLPRMIQHLRHSARASRKLRALAPDKMPWEIEHFVHGLERLARCFGEREEYPCETRGGDAGEEEHGAAGRHADEHEGHSLSYD